MAEITKHKESFALNILRAFACLWVVAVHLEQNIVMPEILGEFCKRGSTGVEFFFILSGFLAYQSLDVIGEQKRKNGISDWWKKRFIRILPVYYVVILFYALYFGILGGVPKDETGLGWFRYILLLNQWVPSKEIFWMNLGAVWTVSIFVFFYLIAPIYHKLVNNYYTSWGAVVLTYLMARIIERSTEWLRPLQFIYFFSIGIMVYLALKEQKEKNLIAIVSFLLLLLFVKRSDSGLIPAFLAAIFIVGTYSMSCNCKAIKKVVNVICKYSYSLYLVHAAVVTVLLNHRPDSDIIYLFVFVGTSVIFTWLMYQMIEKRLGTMLLDHRRINKCRNKE